MAEQSQPKETPQGSSQFGKSTRRRFLSRLGMASLLASAGPVLGERSRDEAAAIPETKEAMAAVEGTIPVTLRVNGKKYDLRIDPRTTLLDCLREHLHLTGSKKGCDHGQCGACTVHVNGRRMNSCLCLAAMYQGDEITTIEGVGQPGNLHPIQEAFVAHDAYQCGYCTCGQIMSAVALLTEPVGPEDAEVKELMSGNICRCGAYQNIVAAIQSVRQSARPEKAG
jgi:xanthine dehydrogenase YagT iron-sulfur-binding subunit